MIDREGRRYLDACSGAVVCNIGHGVAEINEAIQHQLSQIAFAHTSQFVSEPALRLAERLIGGAPAGFSGGGRAYFVSGGSEAIETALKMARGYFYEQGLEKKHVAIARWSSYHGSTQGALSLTGHPARRAPYLPILAGNPHIAPSYPYRCPCAAPGSCDSEACGLALADELEEAILRAGSENVMAFVAEPVVGAALGAVAPHQGYFKRIREICDRYNVLLIADEVLTGVGRLGVEHGLSHFGIEADLIALGKGLAAGYMPLAAVLASRKVVAAFEANSGVFEHGFTYSAHPVSCAAGLAVLRYIDEHALISRVANRESTVKRCLEASFESGIVGDLRGKGFLWGLELVSDRGSKTPFPANLRISQALAATAADLGMLIYPGSGSVNGTSGDHILVAPPFTITEEELEQLGARSLCHKSNATVSWLSEAYISGASREPFPKVGAMPCIAQVGHVQLEAQM